MIILRTMGTIQLRQAVLPRFGHHDANYTSFETSRKRSSCVLLPERAFDNAAASCRLNAPWTDCGWLDLARGWRASFHRITPCKSIKCLTDSIISRCNTSIGTMGYQTASSIHGQPGTSHPDSNTDRDWPCVDDAEHRQASCTPPRCLRTAVSSCSFTPKIDSQHLGKQMICLQYGGILVR